MGWLFARALPLLWWRKEGEGGVKEEGGATRRRRSEPGRSHAKPRDERADAVADIDAVAGAPANQKRSRFHEAPFHTHTHTNTSLSRTAAACDALIKPKRTKESIIK
jgi:hypothetical protein